jgi:hypothetical protein
VIVGSLLLIVVAVGLLVTGLVQGANALLVASIAASLLAALALIIGGRQAAAARAATSARSRNRVSRERTVERVEAPSSETAHTERIERVERRQPVGAGVGSGASSGSSSSNMSDETSLMAPIRDEDPYPPSIPQQSPADAADDHYTDQYDEDDDYEDEDDPEDEPPAQQTSPADVARISELDSDVYVIDGRPRYHLRGCVHTLGRENEPLPVGEAVELGFTPCSVCEPDSALLAAARRV